MKKVYRGITIGSAKAFGLEVAEYLEDEPGIYYVAVNVACFGHEEIVDILTINGGGDNDSESFTRTHVSPDECLDFYPAGGSYPWKCGEDVALFYTRDKALIGKLEERMYRKAIQLGY